MDKSDKLDASTRLSNAFSPEYLDRLRERSEPPASGESEGAGPWELRNREGIYPLFRSWEGYEHGDVPEAVFDDREAGLIFFAVRPASGREPVFRCLQPVAAEGFAVESGGEEVGTCASSTRPGSRPRTSPRAWRGPRWRSPRCWRRADRRFRSRWGGSWAGTSWQPPKGELGRLKTAPEVYPAAPEVSRRFLMTIGRSLKTIRCSLKSSGAA